MPIKANGEKRSNWKGVEQKGGNQTVFALPSGKENTRWRRERPEIQYGRVRGKKGICWLGGERDTSVLVRSPVEGVHHERVLVKGKGGKRGEYLMDSSVSTREENQTRGDSPPMKIEGRAVCPNWNNLDRGGGGGSTQLSSLGTPLNTATTAGEQRE